MKPIIDSVLPFSSSIFFVFMVLVILSAGKFSYTRLVSYTMYMLIISVAYIVLLYPKPLHLVGLILYLYLALLALRKWYNSQNVALPMILLALPMIAMKGLGVLSEIESGVLTSAKGLVQIAGISYMVFKAIGLYIDERNHKNRIDPLDFFLFLSFVPTLLIGPIDRFQRFTADLKNGYANIREGFWAKGWNNLLLGLLYKFIIAEAIRRLVLVYLIDDGSLLYHVSYMYTYLIYLFFDFAGYSLLAIGFGNFLGVDVPINFDKPFLAVNPKEFWKKWHKSLGDWLNDYFFKPIFKYLTQKKILVSIQRQGIALFLTFTLMGFWNGFELHYILSGMLFGLYSVIHNYYVYKCKRLKRDVFFGKMSEKWVRVISIFMMFNLVAFAIYIFSGKLF